MMLDKDKAYALYCKKDGYIPKKKHQSVKKKKEHVPKPVSKPVPILKPISSTESAKIHLGYFDNYIQTIIKNTKQNPIHFTFERGNRIAQLTNDYIDKYDPLLYRTEYSKTPLVNAGIGKFILEDEMDNEGIVYIERNGSRSSTKYKATQWEITNIHPENVKLEDIDNALDNIYYAREYNYPGSAEKVKKVHFERGNSSIFLADGYPRENHLCAVPFDYPIKMQKKAIDAFMAHPQEHNKPIVKLLEEYDSREWPSFITEEIENYEFLTLSEDRGQDAQKTAVKQALSTPDFSILEGPPGSGKTTVLLETIVQAIKQGKRILLVASTHVAVDNILERLEEKNCMGKYGIFPIRIGDEDNVNPKLNKYRLSEVAETERERLLSFYQKIHPEEKTKAQSEMQALISSPNAMKSLENLVIDSSNLVCGTTIGILQAPMIHDSNRSVPQPLFDIMILDEASKTTFTEFLVPALYARKFVISGDTKQLTPFTDEKNIEHCLHDFLPDSTERQVCKAVFDVGTELIRTPNSKKCRVARIILCSNGESFHDLVDKVRQQIEWFDKTQNIGDRIVFKAIENPDELKNTRTCYMAISSNILVITPSVMTELAPILPPTFSLQRYSFIDPDILENHDNRRKALHYDSNEDDSDWEAEVAWRLCRKFELHKTPESKSRERYIHDIDCLYPKWKDNNEEKQNKLQSIEQIEAAALASILELLETGFTSTNHRNSGFVLADGLQEKDWGSHWDSRHTLLEYQWRMHPEIAHFPKEAFYNNTALRTTFEMKGKRDFKYQRGSRVIWIDTTHNNICKNRNEYEAGKVIEKLDDFLFWAVHNPKKGGWKISLITFYLSQRELLSNLFQSMIKEKYGFSGRSFHFNREDIQITIATVDRFQGQEADVVYLSFVRSNGSNPKRNSHLGFLDSANRMNVALTRAKYQLYLFGSLNNFGKTDDEIPPWLSKLALETPKEATSIHY